MMHTPWIGLLALVAMFAIPYLPSWLFEGPRTVRHWPRRHVCGECHAPWTEGHVCAPDVVEDVVELVPPARPPVRTIRPVRPIRGELRRLGPSRELERRPPAWLSR
jgi:hypothetical protein